MHVLTRPQVAAQGVWAVHQAGPGGPPHGSRKGGGEALGVAPVTTISAQRLASVSPWITTASARTPWNWAQNWVGLCPGARGGALRPWFLKSDS